MPSHACEVSFNENSSFVNIEVEYFNAVCTILKMVAPRVNKLHITKISAHENDAALINVEKQDEGVYGVDISTTALNELYDHQENQPIINYHISADIFADILTRAEFETVIKSVFGVEIRPSKLEKNLSFQKNEIKFIYTILSLLSSSLNPQSFSQTSFEGLTITRRGEKYGRGKNKKNECAVGMYYSVNNKIEIYQEAFDRDDQFQRTLVHELGHYLWLFLKEDLQKKYLEISDQNLGENVSAYSAEQNEDFPEHFSHFVIDPATKKYFPQKSKFIQESIFDNITFKKSSHISFKINNGVTSNFPPLSKIEYTYQKPGADDHPNFFPLAIKTTFNQQEHKNYVTFSEVMLLNEENHRVYLDLSISHFRWVPHSDYQFLDFIYYFLGYGKYSSLEIGHNFFLYPEGVSSAYYRVNSQQDAVIKKSPFEELPYPTNYIYNKETKTLTVNTIQEVSGGPSSNIRHHYYRGTYHLKSFNLILNGGNGEQKVISHKQINALMPSNFKNQIEIDTGEVQKNFNIDEFFSEFIKQSNQLDLNISEDKKLTLTSPVIGNCGYTLYYQIGNAIESLRFEFDPKSGKYRNLKAYLYTDEVSTLRISSMNIAFNNFTRYNSFDLTPDQKEKFQKILTSKLRKKDKISVSEKHIIYYKKELGMDSESCNCYYSVETKLRFRASDIAKYNFSLKNIRVTGTLEKENGNAKFKLTGTPEKISDDIYEVTLRTPKAVPLDDNEYFISKIALNHDYYSQIIDISVITAHYGVDSNKYKKLDQPQILLPQE